MAAIRALFYEKANGDIPVEDFLNSLDVKMNAKMTRAISALQEYGHELREPYSKHLKDGIFELRAQVGSNISRVFYFFYFGSNAILTHGFIKKSNKTPASEIKKAKQYRSEFLSREENK